MKTAHGEIASSADLRATKATAMGVGQPKRSIRIRGLNHFFGQGETRKRQMTSDK